MGDSTAYQLTIHECPEEQRSALFDVIARFGLLEDWSAPLGEALVIGQTYTAEPICCGSADDIAAELSEAAPGCVFSGWDNPAGEPGNQWLGTFNAYSPRLGSFSGECDSSGSVVLFPNTVFRVLAESSTVDDAKERFNRFLGTAWMEMIRGYDNPQPKK